MWIQQSFFVRKSVLVGMIGGNDLANVGADLGILTFGCRFKLFKHFKQIILVDIDGFSDENELVFGGTESFLVHQKLLIKLFSGAKSREHDVNVLVRLIAGQTDEVFG